MMATKKVRINEVRERLREVASRYDIESWRAEVALVESLEEFYGTSDVVLKSEGVLIGGKYRNVSSKDFKTISATLNQKLLRYSHAYLKEYLASTIEVNGGVLYCRYLRSGEKYHYYQPMLSKDKELHYLVVRVPVEETTPERISVYPISIDAKRIEKRSRNMFRAPGVIVDKRTCRVHASRIEQKFKAFFEKSGLVVVNVIASEDDGGHSKKVLLRSKAPLPSAVIRYARRYFESFSAKAVFLR